MVEPLEGGDGLPRKGRGIPFVAPTMSRNSRLALEVVEVVRSRWPAAYDDLDGALATAYWVGGADVSSWEVLAPMVERGGAPPDEVFDLVWAIASARSTIEEIAHHLEMMSRRRS